MNELFTIGYSTYDIDSFVETLKKNKISVVTDVRSSPYSQYRPEFNKESLQRYLRKHNIAYVFLGEYCGARVDDHSCYHNGKVDFNLVADNNKFKEGLARIRNGINKYIMVIMCAEKDPITCHRFVLICRNLRNDNVKIRHILADGKIEEHSDSELRLLKLHRLNQPELFRSELQRLEEAFTRQGKKIAYEDKELATGTLG